MKVYEVKSGGAKLEIHASSLRVAINDALATWERRGALPKDGVSLSGHYLKNRGEEYRYQFNSTGPDGKPDYQYQGIIWLSAKGGSNEAILMTYAAQFLAAHPDATACKGYPLGHSKFPRIEYAPSAEARQAVAI